MSFFGNKNKEKEKEEDTTVASSFVSASGGRIDGNLSKLWIVILKYEEIVASLISGANDTDAEVRSAVSKSLNEIGKHQPTLVLSASADYITKNGKVDESIKCEY